MTKQQKKEDSKQKEQETVTADQEQEQQDQQATSEASVPASELKELMKPLTDKVKAQQKERGMQQPNPVDAAFEKAVQKLKNLTHES